jgi:hypothetical protein
MDRKLLGPKGVLNALDKREQCVLGRPAWILVTLLTDVSTAY